jgi:hypothetical protein
MSQSQRFSSQDPHATSLILIVGLPGAGKTTRAKEIAATRPALRPTPDHWMIPLFGDSLAGGKRFVLEGRLISVALQALRLTRTSSSPVSHIARRPYRTRPSR